MSAPIVIKRKGSGSAIPKAATPSPEAVLGKCAVLAQAAGGFPEDYERQGFVVFYQRIVSSQTSLPYWARFARWMEDDQEKEMTFSEWAKHAGLPAQESLALTLELDGILGEEPNVSNPPSYAVCVPKIAKAMVLHHRNGALACAAEAPSLKLHVYWTWQLIRQKFTPFAIQTQWAKFAPRLVGINEMSAFMERRSNAGTVRGEIADEIGIVPGDFAANLHPWPIDGSGIVVVHTEGDPEPDGTIPRLSGPTIPASYASGGDAYAIVYTFAGDAIETDVYGLTGENPARVARNENVADPAAWFANPMGNPEPDPSLAPTANAWLPPPTNETGPYRPGYYSREGKLLFAVAGGTQGLFDDASRPSVDVEGYPCLRAAAAEGAIKHDWQLLPPTRGPKVTTPNGERFAGVDADRLVHLMWYYQELAYLDARQGSGMTLEIDVTTGSELEPVENHPNATVAVYAPDGLELVVPTSNAPTPQALTANGDWVYFSVSLAALKTERDENGRLCYSPNQRISYFYDIYPYRRMFNVPPEVGMGGTGGLVPSHAFDGYAPYTLQPA